MRAAVEEALAGVESGEGGPFGAVIVREGEIIASAHNMVLATNDPTAHAEITAIRRAAHRLGRFDLRDCVLYTTCEPCPMCLSAIHWARIPLVYQGAGRKDATEAGFDDGYLYDLFMGKEVEVRVSVKTLEREACLEPMKMWMQKTDKTPY